MDKSFVEALMARWEPGEPYLVAVSGGKDSMALLRLLADAGYRRLVVSHVDHGLRGEVSRGDAAFVKGEAARLGYDYEARQVDVGGFARREKLSLETAARELRYGALAEIASDHGCPRVMLAHHADDRVETVLMNFFRGAGNRGLSGIEADSTRSVDGTLLRLIRPFLAVSQEEIATYVEREGVAYREDESNRSDFALRNRVRHRLLPLLRDIFGRDVRQAVLRASDLAALEERWAAEAVGDFPRKGEGGGLDLRLLREMPEARRNRLLLSWLRESGIPDCGAAEVARVAEVALSNGKPAKTNLPAGHHARRREGLLFIEAPDRA